MIYQLFLVFLIPLFMFPVAYGDSLDNSIFEKISEKKICKEGFEQIIKKTNQKQVCVKESSVKKLIDRGWAQSFEILFESGNSKIASHNLAEKIEKNCQESLTCVLAELKKLETAENDLYPQTILHLIENFEKRDRICHTEGHHLGMALYAHLGDVNQAISQIGLECGGALYHGVLETYFGWEKFNEKPFEKTNPHTICQNESIQSYLEKWECIHGLGHGIVIFFDYDVLEAIKFCDKFELNAELHPCARGVFMENILHVIDTGEGTINDHEIFYPCNAVDPKFAADCYSYQAFYLQSLTTGFGSVENTFGLCDMIEPKEFIKNCYVGLGVGMGDMALREDHREFQDNRKPINNIAVLNCMKGNPEYNSYCLVGVMRVIADQKNSEKAIEFCEIVPENSQQLCFEQFGMWADLISQTPEEKNTLCSKIENPHYSEICKLSSMDDERFI